MMSKGLRRLSLLLVLSAFLCTANGGGGGGSAYAQLSPVSSILAIPGGTTIDFEQATTSNGPAQPLLSPYGIEVVPNPFVSQSTMVPWVTGNVNAPIHNRILTGHFRLVPQVPWKSVGISGVVPFWPGSGDLTISFFDASNELLGQITRNSTSSTTMASYNESAVFLGATSIQPIHSIELKAVVYSNPPVSNLNISWDNLTFAPVPEPSLAVPIMFALMLRALGRSARAIS